MAPASSSSSTATSVQVAVRIRPPTSQDSTSIPARFQRSVIQTTSSTSVSIESPSTSLTGSGAQGAPPVSGGSAPKKQVFTFDQVHPPPTTQYEVYDSTAKPLVSRFVEGFNCTILAYGQTSSGKTFTMTGLDLDLDPSDPNNGMGIIPRAVSSIFSTARQLKEERGGAWSFALKGSFIEIYNEDLIDLLSMDDPSLRREVQIREDKEGHIIWGGLREVNVRNANEVMGLLKKGTSIRRTNETDMNAQSSRSHAIFSLTLTQKKYTGSGHPPRSSSPLPPGGRSPSRLTRPGSMYAGGPSPAANRVASPPLGRPSTPSFASAMGRGAGLRPASALGHMGERSGATIDEETGDWVTIVSKFHFVDLAGSERLKRTAAAGERIKEGISINSGLLALGNVISALGDPSRAKSNTASHVPYRDSKLTRLLQDSLGGNAHTLMIACVSPAEWNAGETLNTLKYANRARNIKNRAVVNEKEDGWDDIEWLQGTITRLRKELKSIKEGGGIQVGQRAEVIEGAGRKVLAQMTELQNNYEDLRGKFVERTEELTRLRRELGEKHRSSTAGAVAGTGKYEEIVGPVIEEYEKTISAMEAELSLNRAALRHTNEMVEEKEEELSVISERHAATELYVEELRSRVAKLSEREASTEAYVRDLEERMKAYDESSLSSTESIADLRRELSRYKETEVHSNKYIADLESRLSRSDESILALQQTVETLERECNRRHDEVETLQGRLESFRQDGENWRSDVEARELHVKQLEEKMREWEQKRKDAGDARLRLGEVVEEVESARRHLEIDVANTTSASISPISSQKQSESPSPELNVNSNNQPSTPSPELESQLLALQQTHTATLADLSSISAKYRDALREISDLAAQIQEAKLGNPSIVEVMSESPSTETEKVQDIPSPSKRRVTSPRSREGGDLQLTSSGRRLFFRQAASAESLHARSLSQSQSLSQELSSVHSRKASFSSHGTGSSHSPSNSHSHTFSHSVSQSVALRPNLSISMPSLSPPPNERSVSSLEKEIMRLQEVLKEREAEISLLEESLKETRREKMSEVLKIDLDTSTESALSPKTLHRFDNIRKTMETGNGHALQYDAGSSYSEDESLERLNELMLSMAQKESHHREVVEDLNSQLGLTRRHLDDLTTLSRDQTLNMSMEIEALQKNHSEDLELLGEVRKRETELVKALEELEASHAAEIAQMRTSHEEVFNATVEKMEKVANSLKIDYESSLSSVRDDLNAKTIALEKTMEEYEASTKQFKADHEKELQRRLEERNTFLETSKLEHDKALAKIQIEHTSMLRQKDEATASALQATEEEYYNALTKLRGDHAEAIKTVASETNATIERLREEHAGELRMAEIARAGSLSESESARNLALQTLQEEHASAIARKEASFAEEIESLNAGFARASRAKDEDHILQIDRLKLEHESAVSKLKIDWRTEVENINSTLAATKDDHATQLQKILKEHEASVAGVQERQASVLREIEGNHQDFILSLKRKHDGSVQDVISEGERVRSAALDSHKEELSSLQTQFDQHLAVIEKERAAIQDQCCQTEEKVQVLKKQLLLEEEKHASVIKSHAEVEAKLRSQHEQKIAELVANHLSSQKQLEHSLEQVRTLSNDSLQEQQTKHSFALATLEKTHEVHVEKLRTDGEVLLQEIEAYKVAADELTLLREQTRQTHELEMRERDKAIASLEQVLAHVGSDRDKLENEVGKLHSELDTNRDEQSKLIQEASKRESLVLELERHRSVLADLQENLQKVKDEKDTLQTEKNRSDALVRDLQAQLARSASPPNVRSPDRNVGFPRGTNLPAIKLPPPTPPPTVPPPPAPKSASAQHVNGDSSVSMSSQGSGFNSSGSSRESQPDSPSTSLGHMGLVNGFQALDSKVVAKVEQQSKQIEEQEAMIKTLNKQLTHCETDLQTHMEIVSKLETSLGDSEKNLRKARMQATEISRERDTLNAALETLRSELSEAKRDLVTVRRSVVEEKQSLEQRLDEERKAKERARQQLDSRMEELQKRKSKFACL